MKRQSRAQLTDDLLAQLLAQWGMTSPREFVGGSTNLVFDVMGEDQQPLVLRITSDAQRDKQTILAELQWVEHLQRQGITVCAPVRTRDGALLHEVRDGNRQYCAAAFQRAPGVPVRRADLDRNHMIKLGRMLGRLHASSAAYPQVKRMNWDHNLRALLTLLPDDPEAREALASTAEMLSRLPRDRASFGLVHNDLHMRNYHVDGDTIWLFDFDSCAYNWYASDIACTWYLSLSWTAGTDAEIWQLMHQPIINALLEGYHQVHHMHQQWINRIALFFRFRALSLYAYLAKRHGRADDDAQQQRLQIARAAAMTEPAAISSWPRWSP